MVGHDNNRGNIGLLRSITRFVIIHDSAITGIIIIAIAIVLISTILAIENTLFQIFCVVIGFLVAQLFTRGYYLLLSIKEESLKLTEGGYPYDPDTNTVKVSIGDHSTTEWYLPIVRNGSEIKELIVDDHPDESFSVNTFIQCNSSKLMTAHKTSFFTNADMYRLADVNIEDGNVTLSTMRTTFFNDLVTNRAMDYVISGHITLRGIYEYRRQLTPLPNSQMSNHIGINTLVFFGDEIILLRKGNNATMSKDKIVSAEAFGMRDADVMHLKDDDVLESEDILYRVPLFKLSSLFSDGSEKLGDEKICSLYESGRIKVYFLGFGRLIYTGGKPQFYYAVCVDPDSGLKPKLLNDRAKHYSTLYATHRFDLVRDGSKKIVFKDSWKGKKIKCNVEDSFLVNCWQLSQNPGLEDVPEWFYRTIHHEG